LLPEFPGVFVDDVTAIEIRQGRDFNVSPFRLNPGSPHVKAIGPDGTLVAIGRIVMPHVYHPLVVMGL
jgi:tRNA pseudouridine55 synthase